jgi:CBS domain-containing protein
MMAKALKVSDYMARKVITITKDKTIKDAALILKRHNISTIIVIEKQKPIGIITERDIINKVVSVGKPLTTKVQIVMSKKFITASDAITDIEAATIMTKNRIKKLPILHKGKLVGVITETDLLKILSKKWAL